jgi:hypothetical protein
MTRTAADRALSRVVLASITNVATCSVWDPDVIDGKPHVHANRPLVDSDPQDTSLASVRLSST